MCVLVGFLWEQVRCWPNIGEVSVVDHLVDVVTVVEEKVRSEKNVCEVSWKTINMFQRAGIHYPGTHMCPGKLLNFERKITILLIACVFF